MASGVPFVFQEIQGGLIMKHFVIHRPRDPFSQAFEVIVADRHSRVIPCRFQKMPQRVIELAPQNE